MGRGMEREGKKDKRRCRLMESIEGGFFAWVGLRQFFQMEINQSDRIYFEKHRAGLRLGCFTNPCGCALNVSKYVLDVLLGLQNEVARGKDRDFEASTLEPNESSNGKATSIIINSTQLRVQAFAHCVTHE